MFDVHYPIQQNSPVSAYIQQRYPDARDDSNLTTNISYLVLTFSFLFRLPNSRKKWQNRSKKHRVNRHLYGSSPQFCLFFDFSLIFLTVLLLYNFFKLPVSLSLLLPTFMSPFSSLFDFLRFQAKQAHAY